MQLITKYFVSIFKKANYPLYIPSYFQTINPSPWNIIKKYLSHFNFIS